MTEGTIGIVTRGITGARRPTASRNAPTVAWLFEIDEVAAEVIE